MIYFQQCGRNGRDNTFPGWWCTREEMHDGPCALEPYALRVRFKVWRTNRKWDRR